MFEVESTLNQELKRIEDFLICGICYEHLDTSVVTPCSHNYCSLCIRKYLHYKTQCPACFEETFEKDLRVNKTLDEILLNFIQFKDKLREHIGKIPTTSCIEPNTLQYNGIKSNNTVTNSTPPRHSPLNSQNVIYSPSVSSPKVNGSPSNLNSPSTSGRSKMLSFFTPKSSKKVWTCFTSNTDRSKTVNCPVCHVDVPEAHINKHLDECLKRDTMKEPPLPNLGPKRKPLPKLVSNLMKDSVLRKKLKEFGLSCNGDRRTIESRLQRYIVVYNAECDRAHPRSISDIIRQCSDEEAIEKKSFNTSFFENRLQVTRNNTESTIEEARKKYLENNKNSYFNLIAKLKENTKNSSTRLTTVDRNDDDMNIYESDSDTSCPLLRYSRDDTIIDNLSETSNTTININTICDEEQLNTVYNSPCSRAEPPSPTSSHSSSRKKFNEQALKTLHSQSFSNIANIEETIVSPYSTTDVNISERSPIGNENFNIHQNDKESLTAEDYLLVEDLLNVSPESHAENPETNNQQDENYHEIEQPVRRSTRKRNQILDHAPADKRVTKRRKKMKNTNVDLDTILHDHGDYENHVGVIESICDEESILNTNLY